MRDVVPDGADVGAGRHREGLAAGRCIAASANRGGLRHIDRDHRAVVDDRVTTPGRNRLASGIECGLLQDAGVPVGGHRAVASEGAMNAVVVQGDAVGTTLYYGKGAGSEPTASAVVADLVDITRLATADPDHRVPHLAFQPDSLADTPILGIEQVQTSFYLRLRVADEAGVLSSITTILADNNISIDAVLQRESAEGEKQTDLIILTHDTIEGRMRTALAKMQSLATVLAPIVSIRKEELA